MKQPKRGRLRLHDGSYIRRRPCRGHHVWAYEVLQEHTHDDRAFRPLVVFDEFSRDCLAILIVRRLNSDEVLTLLTDLFVAHGPPDHIRSDNGPEFWAHAVRNCLKQLDVSTLFRAVRQSW